MDPLTHKASLTAFQIIHHPLLPDKVAASSYHVTNPALQTTHHTPPASSQTTHHPTPPAAAAAAAAGSQAIDQAAQATAISKGPAASTA